MTRYFIVLLKGDLFGLFQSNHEGAIDFQISQLKHDPNIVVKEVGKEQYEKCRADAKEKFGEDEAST